MMEEDDDHQSDYGDTSHVNPTLLNTFIRSPTRSRDGEGMEEEVVETGRIPRIPLDGNIPWVGHSHTDGMYDFESVQESLRKHCTVSLRNFSDKGMNIPEECRGTMDSVSRAFELLPEDCNALQIQNTDGKTWAICDVYGAQLSEKMQKFIYWFHTLSEHVQDLSRYVVPTDTIKICYDRRNTKVAEKMTTRRFREMPAVSMEAPISEMPSEEAHSDSNEGGGEIEGDEAKTLFQEEQRRGINLAKYLQQHLSLVEEFDDVLVPILKMRIGLTGAWFYDVNIVIINEKVIYCLGFRC